MAHGVDGDLSQIDLEPRLRAIPETAGVRGAFFNVVRHSLTRRGLSGALLLEPGLARTYRSYRLYSARDWLRVFATGGALVDPDPVQGMAQIFGDSPRYFASTWYGRMFQELLQPDPLPALRWIERSRDHLCTYGHWRLETRGPTRVVMHMFEEYAWVEAHRGGCEGLLAACGVQGSVRAVQEEMFHGRLEIEWSRGR